MEIKRFLRKIKKHFSDYTPLITVLISRKNLIHNLNEYKQNYPKIGFAPVLKSNAYGHGLAEVAEILDREEKPFFVVDSLFEAKILRENGIKSDILVIGYTSPANITHSKLTGTAFAITSANQLEEISKLPNKTIYIHLKIDTGMHRQGIALSQIDEVIKTIKNSANLVLEGICSHLADADSTDQTFTKKQITEWNKVVNIFKKNFQNIKHFHLAATAGTGYLKNIQGNVARLGIGLYGAIEGKTLELKPVLEMKTVISSVKTLGKEEGIGYNLTHKTDKDIKTATVPAGYFEGVDRRLSNHGFLKIGNRFCPIIGRVSMNITSIDVTSISGVKEGEEVIVISSDKTDENSILNIAKMTKTIAYEILVHIPQHLKRIVVD